MLLAPTIEPDLELPRQTRVLVISDLHLADGSGSDLFCGAMSGRRDARKARGGSGDSEHDALFCRTLRREAAEADAVVLAGDILDHLRTPDNEVIERAHPYVLDALRELAVRRPVFFVLGNHDDEQRSRAAFERYSFHRALSIGREFGVTHGHQFDIHWGTEKPSHLASRLHEMIEQGLGHPIRQPFRDYVNLPNRVVHRLFFRWTQTLRLFGSMCRTLGYPAPYQRWQRIDNFWARGQWGDIGNIFGEAIGYLGEHPHWRTLLIGHSHVPGRVQRGELTYVNSGSWCLGEATFVRVIDGKPRVIDAHSGAEIRDGRYRALDTEVELPDMAGWFRRYYRGFFRYDLAALERDFPAQPKAPRAGYLHDLQPWEVG